MYCIQLVIIVHILVYIRFIIGVTVDIIVISSCFFPVSGFRQLCRNLNLHSPSHFTNPPFPPPLGCSVVAPGPTSAAAMLREARAPPKCLKYIPLPQVGIVEWGIESLQKPLKRLK